MQQCKILEEAKKKGAEEKNTRFWSGRFQLPPPPPKENKTKLSLD